MTDEGPGVGAAGRDDPAADRRLSGPVLVYRDADGGSRFVLLDSASSLTIGRGEGCDVQLPWDKEVSRVHAKLELVGSAWTLLDDGFSRNGTFLNGDRLSGRRRLRDGDTFVVGATSVSYQSFGGARSGRSQVTRVASDAVTVSALSLSQRQVLTALCRPFKGGDSYATPATNQQIADELFLSVDAVKTHLRTLFHKMHIEDLPQNQKRAKLVERAFSLGLLSRRDL